jgi:hypothetical protein
LTLIHYNIPTMGHVAINRNCCKKSSDTIKGTTEPGLENISQKNCHRIVT